MMKPEIQLGDTYSINTETGEVTQYAKYNYTMWQKILMKFGKHQIPKDAKITKGRFKWTGHNPAIATFIPNEQ
jgi:hypothetical protein